MNPDGSVDKLKARVVAKGFTQREGVDYDASLEEEVYMKLVARMEGAEGENKVAREWKAIYGLRQASRMWNQHIDGILRKMGIVRLSRDHGVYVK